MAAGKSTSRGQIRLESRRLSARRSLLPLRPPHLRKGSGRVEPQAGAKLTERTSHGIASHEGARRVPMSRPPASDVLTIWQRLRRHPWRALRARDGVRTSWVGGHDVGTPCYRAVWWAPEQMAYLNAAVFQDAGKQSVEQPIEWAVEIITKNNTVKSFKSKHHRHRLRQRSPFWARTHI